MVIAELRGKFTPTEERSEDILTSNVFSFFKYASRMVYLRKLLGLLNIRPSDDELEEAEFIFWPAFDDRTEPDVVILVGRYYLLFEAKFLSGYGEESEDRATQLVREIEGGLAEAKTLGRDFRVIAITADYLCPAAEFSDLPAEYRDCLVWMNWQSVARILLEKLEHEGETAADYHFARDLYDLLDKKNLRGFLAFDRLAGAYSGDAMDGVFFQAETAIYRGQFIGFPSLLQTLTPVKQHPGRLFYSRVFFRGFPEVDRGNATSLFLEKVKDEQ